MLFNTKRVKRRRIAGSIVSWILVVGAAVLLAYLFITYFMQTTTMLGESMKPVLKNGETVMVYKFGYHFTNPKRYDIVVFESNKNNSSHFYIKRVIGLPGETIQIKDGEIYINDQKLVDAPFKQKIVTSGLAEEAVTLGKEEYFVMGDNVNNSEDSRAANIGNINRDMILGKVSAK